MDRSWGEANVVPGMTVVDTVVGRDAEVHQVIPGFGVEVWIRERGYERERWPWAMITIRTPRLIKRYPRPRRYPRLEPTKHCHCNIGRMEVQDVEKREVLCTRCKFLIGYESFPRRFERATDLLRKADNAKAKQAKPKIPKRVPRPKQQAVRRTPSSRAKGRAKSLGPVLVRPARKSTPRKVKANVVHRTTPRRRQPSAVPKNKKVRTVGKGKAIPKTETVPTQEEIPQNKEEQSTVEVVQPVVEATSEIKPV